MIIGAGRLARVVAVALADAGMTTIAVTSRKQDAGEKLVAFINSETGATATFVPLGQSVAVDGDIAAIVDATSLGAANPEAKLPLNVESLGPKMVVVEAAYNTARTWLTHQAAERGCRVIDGLSLYVQQTALAFRRWTGVTPDTVAMREAAEEFLGI